MLEEMCRNEIYKRCLEYIPPEKIVRLKGREESEERKFAHFMKATDGFTIYDRGMAVKLMRSSQKSVTLRLAVGLFSRNGAYMCDHMVNGFYHNSWETAMEHYGTFEAMFDGFKEYFRMRKDKFMEETKSTIISETGNLPKQLRSPNSHGGVANLLRVLTKTMTEQGSSIRTIAKVQYEICKQAGIYIPDEFITDVMVAFRIDPECSVTFEEHQEREKKRLRGAHEQ